MRECPGCLGHLGLWAYCRAGGALEACGSCRGMDATSAMAVCSSTWRNKHGAICTFSFATHSVDFHFDAAGRWISDQYRPNPSSLDTCFRRVEIADERSVASIVTALETEGLGDRVEVWGDHDGLVVMISTGATIYFDRCDSQSRGILSKIVAKGAVGDASRRLARQVLRPIDMK